MKEKRNVRIEGEKAWRRKLRREMFYRYFCRLYVLVLGGGAWVYLYKLCRFGGIRKNIPPLAICGVAFLMLFLRFWLVCRKLQKNSLPFTYQEIFIEGDNLRLQINDTSAGFSTGDIVYYRFDQKYCYIAVKQGMFFLVSCEGENQEFVRLKLSSLGLRRSCILRIPIMVSGAMICLIGAAFVARSAMPYQGKLSWYLRDLKNTRRMELVHDNLYEDKLQGILEDVEQKVKLPEKLCLATSFSLHFKPDGTIVRFDVMLKGFDAEGNYVDSYLISYDRNKSEKIRVDLHGVTNGVYEEEKDFSMLVLGMESAPVEQTVNHFKEREYGILYYGWREFGSYEENIIYLSDQKEIVDARDTIDGYGVFSGYSISVYCPDNEAITPYRYLYLPKEQFQEVKMHKTWYQTDDTAALIDTQPESANQETGIQYTVVKGDTLWSIADRFLDSPFRYVEIYEMNKDVIEAKAQERGKQDSDNGNFLCPGLTLQLRYVSQVSQ